MPKRPSGGSGLALPMEISKFMPPDALRTIYDKALTTAACEEVDWPQLHRDTADAISKSLRRELAESELALLTEDE